MELKLNEKSRFRSLLENNEREIVLFGAGSFGIKMKSIFDGYNIHIKYFCDNDINKQGKEVGGIKVLAPSELSELNEDSHIIITSTYYKEIYQQLLKMKLKNVDCFSPWMLDAHNSGFLKKCIVDNIDEINKLYNLLDEDKSKEVLENILNYRLTFDIKYLMKAVINEDIYFDKEIIKLSEHESFLDAGAFDGDTIIEYINKVNGKFDNIYAFEPDSSNYQRLINNEKLNKYKSKIKFEQKGLYIDDKGINFDSLSNMGSRIDGDSGNEHINTMSIDLYAKDNELTFVKMDIEGAEIDAILGAKKTIKEKKPKLAICIYHRIDDLWRIPLLIKQIQPDYKVYIRQHAYNLFDSVCYAI